MTQATAITVADAQATPVSHTFTPIGTDPSGVMWFEDQSASNALGYWRLSIQRSAPNPNVSAGTSSQNRVFKYRIGLHLPVLENTTNATVSGVAPAPQLAYVERAVVEFYTPERAALLDRQNIAKMLPLILQNAQLVTMVQTNGILN